MELMVVNTGRHVITRLERHCLISQAGFLSPCFQSQLLNPRSLKSGGRQLSDVTNEGKPGVTGGRAASLDHDFIATDRMCEYREAQGEGETA
jgi:hypothetical protein